MPYFTSERKKIISSSAKLYRHFTFRRV